MPEYLSPGVYVEEIPLFQKTIKGVSASLAASAGQRTAITASWDQLILPAQQLQTLRKIAATARISGGLDSQANVTAMFSGDAGQQKTLAAKVLAKELGLHLYRIDFAKVVSKHNDETEENLRRIFEAGQQNWALLYFDETDALLGQRTEAQDSHDRYANIEINWLLRRMEEYQGLAVLATNRKSDSDETFLRRLRFIVDFTAPDEEAY